MYKTGSALLSALTQVDDQCSFYISHNSECDHITLLYGILLTDCQYLWLSVSDIPVQCILDIYKSWFVSRAMRERQ